MHTIAWWPTVAVLLIASGTDIKSRRIPNWLVLPFLFSGIVVSGWMEGWRGLVQSGCGIGTAVLVFGVLFLVGGMGMGDVKLCAAVGAWIGPSQLLTAIILTAYAGGLMALCWALWSGFLGELLHGAGEILFGLRRRKLRPHPNLALANPQARKMPYAPAIAIGTLISFFPR